MKTYTAEELKTILASHALWLQAYSKGVRAYLQGAALPHYKIVPQEGEFIAYKKVASGAILRLLIPAYAARTNSLVGRKCRASHAIVLSSSIPGPLVSNHDPKFVYEVGKEASVANFDPDICVECTSGIHFFISEEEAHEY